ncbi:MAG TPA: 2Fe-2S iron-sulfur cluster-binding protein [Candidatus Kapabacteria bacterium]|nr:2Fe-2S iron-sulfur cluster-binding protein [Candidatus Kapabacteria bacterium]
MPTVTIDGVQFEAKPGQTIIQIALDNGIDIPHFCWHPGLSVAGNCRMCIVDVEKIPKPSIACATTISDGMVVHTKNEKALKAREDVMEFLLINHPLDCPICDEAGQCKLQDYAFNHSRGESRFEETKNHKDKRIPFGPNVLFDGERCISCSRCIRFGEEIADQPILTFVERGDHVTIRPFPGAELDNPYSMNVIDICPVGALTSRDFRFKARPWDMSFTETVCPSCARGCSIRVGARDNEILRLEPSPNPNINDFWMCDAGRLESYPSVNAADRVSGAFIRNNNKLEPALLSDAVHKIASELKRFKAAEIAFIASANATLEDNYVFLEAAKQKGSKTVGYFSHVSGSDAKLLIRADKTPNAFGLKVLGVTPFGDELTADLLNGKIKAVYSLEDDFLVDASLAQAFEKVEFFACHATNLTATSKRADVVLPAASWAEQEGVFVNFEGWAQKLTPAIETSHIVRGFNHMAQSRLDRFGSPFDKWAQRKKVDALESWRLAQDVASVLGAKLDFRYTEDVFDQIAAHIAELKGLSYELLGALGRPLNGIDKPFKESVYREVYQIDTLDAIPELMS